MQSGNTFINTFSVRRLSSGKLPGNAAIVFAISSTPNLLQYNFTLTQILLMANHYYLAYGLIS
jgi:hypothetical protein